MANASFIFLFGGQVLANPGFGVNVRELVRPQTLEIVVGGADKVSTKYNDNAASLVDANNNTVWRNEAKAQGKRNEKVRGKSFRRKLTRIPPPSP